MKGYVYLLSCEPLSDKYYIGITVNRPFWRLCQHLYGARKNKKSTNPKNVWLRSLAKNNIEPIIEELETIENIDRKTLMDELGDLEKLYIGLFRSWGLKVLNRGEGGRTNYGVSPSLETRLIISKNNANRVISKETGARISARLKGKKKPARFGAKVAKTKKERGYRHSDEVRKIISDAVMSTYSPVVETIRSINKAKLSPHDVVLIRGMLSQGVRHPKIAKEFNVAVSNISAIATGRSWKWLTPNSQIA